MKHLNYSLAFCLQKDFLNIKCHLHTKYSGSYRSKHVRFFLHTSEESYKKIEFKRNLCSGDSGCSANGVRARRQVLRSELRAHTRSQVKYMIFEHVHSKGMNIRITQPYERDIRYFLSTWIDSRLPHIRNRVTQRLIWLLKIVGLFVGMLSVPRFPGLLAHWAFFRRCEIRNDDRWQAGHRIVPVLLCYNKSYGVLELNIPFWWLIEFVSGSGVVRGWRCKQV